jgi:hypothetical protein
LLAPLPYAFVVPSQGLEKGYNPGMETLEKQYKGRGKLIFEDNSAADVMYAIDEYQEFCSEGLGGQIHTLRDRRGSVTHAEGHPAWHPTTSLHPGPFTLEMGDGRKLKVLMQNSHGTVQATGDFF